MCETLAEKLRLIDTEKIHHKYEKFINELKKIKYINIVSVSRMESENGLFILLNININLPSDGPITDIRDTEEILLYLSSKYPYKAPYVLPNRLNFPYDCLPHLNPNLIDDVFIDSPYLCLHRGNTNEWFINIEIFEFMHRVQKWFEDAAIGELVKDDGFEPMLRLEGLSYFEYDYDNICMRIQNASEKCVLDFMPAFLGDVDKDIKYTEYLHVKETITKVETPSIPCGLIYNKNQSINDKYLGRNIQVLDDLIDFIDKNLIQRLIRKWNNYHPNSKNLDIFVIVYGIKRPQNLIGLNNNIEFINILIVLNEYKDKVNISGNEKIHLYGHVNRFSSNLAANLSNTRELMHNSTMIIGNGAVGSKVSMSLARMGLGKQTIIDNDLILPHNFIRHSLTPDSIKIFGSKAIAQANVINYMYEEGIAKAQSKNLIELTADEFKKENYIIDCTASNVALRFLEEANLGKSRLIRTEIALDGELGITFVEGIDRNPDIMDMRVDLYYLSTSIKEIDRWLSRGSNDKLEYQDFQIGCGCSSDTMKIDDALISNHASIVPMRMKNKFNNNGEIIINRIDENNLSNNYCKLITILPRRKFVNNDWTIRISEDKLSEMNLLVSLSENETGGIFIGNIDKATKIIRIVDFYIPEDNKGTPTGLVRGFKGIKQFLKSISKSTGNQITYAGEWHSHPHGEIEMSSTDLHTLTELSTSLGILSIPAVMAIFNEKDVKINVLED